MTPPIVTLTTDFGDKDGYVGAMKGVILGINPGVTIVDISHQVPAQNIAHAAFVLGSVYRYFPTGTLHVCVVDPGVGTSRRPLLFETPGGRFVAPDNGVLTHVLGDYQSTAGKGPAGGSAGSRWMEPLRVPVPSGCTAFVLKRSELWRRPVSDTFHGRDVFAPVAAHLTMGVQAAAAGDPTGDIECLGIPPPIDRDGAIEGRVIFVDHFGNMATNIRPERIHGGLVTVQIGGRRIEGLSRSYASGGALLAIIGSHGYLEVAARNGSAAEDLGLGVGARLTVLAS